MNVPTPRALRLAPSVAAVACVFGAAVSRADGSPATALLSIRVVGLRNDSGQIGCGLWGSEKGFPKDHNLALQTKWCPIVNKESSCSFDPIAAGTYAVACFHDENKNSVLDKGMFGIPTEGVVVSNEAKGFMGPPSFKAAKFSFAGAAAELRLRMGY